MSDFRVYLIDTSPMKVSTTEPLDFDANKLQFKVRQNLLEIGWVDIKEREETKTEVELTLAGEYSILPCNAPGLFRLKGIIPAKFRD